MMKDFRTIHPRDTIFRMLYGLPMPPSEPELRLRLVKAAMIIARADGELSEAEWEATVAVSRMLEMPDEDLEQLSRFDFANTPIEELLPERTLLPGVARVTLYNAIQIASADQYHDREKAAVARAAQHLGVAPDVVAVIEDLVAQDLLARRTRAHVLFPGLVGGAK